MGFQQTFDPTVYASLLFLFGVAAQFRAMDGYAFLRSVVVGLERRVGILFAVALVSMAFSPFILNDVMIIILTPVVIRYAKAHSVDAVPLVVAEITFTNLASSLTPIGNPQNILLWSATKISFFGFVAGTWELVLISALLGCLVLTPFAHKLGRPRELPSAFGSTKPGVYLLAVACVTIISDFAGLRPYLGLGLAFVLGFAFTRNKAGAVLREFDLRAMLVLYLFITVAGVASVLLTSTLASVVAPVARGSQPYSGAFIALASNLISNVPVAQLILNNAAVTSSSAPHLAVQLGIAGNLGPIASFANILALQASSKGGVSVKRIVALQVGVGLVTYLPALF